METKICSKCKEEKDVIFFESFRNTCKDCRKEYLKDWHLINQDSKKKYDKEYQIKNFEKEKQRKKLYYQNNKEKVNKYWRERKKIDPLLRLTLNMRSRMKIFLKLNTIKKKNLFIEIIGCSPEFLKEHIEKQFSDGMSWELMGKFIHIDHIIPLSSAKTEEEVYKLCYYTNLQPLWAEDNLKKGNKII